MTPNPFVTPFAGIHPQVAADAFVDVSARLIGNVRILAGATIWPGAVLRADEEEIAVGEGSAVLDLCLLESPHGHPVLVEAGALISHKACLHGATVRAGALVGIGAIVLDGAVVGEGALVGAGALVPPGAVIPPGVLVLGQPAKVVRELKLAERENVREQLALLRSKAARYHQG